MDNVKAAKLLAKLRFETKRAGFLPLDLAKGFFNKFYTPLKSYFDEAVTDTSFKNPEVQQAYDEALSQEAKKQVLKALGLGLGAGASIRGFHGLMNTINKPDPYKPTRVVDLPIQYNKPKEKEKKAVAKSIYDVEGFIPGMLLGVPLATYGGWKAVDKILDRQRQKRVENELEEAKNRYEQALLGSYKKAEDTNLNTCDVLLEKQALFGSLRNLYYAYALGSLPLAYAGMDSYMKKRSQRHLLTQALKEKAMHQAYLQPPEIYAHIEEPKKEQE